MCNSKIKKPDILLSIVIPTYNRPDILLKTIELLHPQIYPNVDLTIIDNRSNDESWIRVSDIVKSYNHPRINLVRNISNIGANANILRSVEHAKGNYIWILGDDDYPSYNAVQIILDDLSDHSLLCVNYASEDSNQPTRFSIVKVDNFLDYLINLKSISEVVFISSLIYKTDILRNGLEFGNLYQSTMAPHFVAFASGIERSCYKGGFLISTNNLFTTISNNNANETSWALYRAFVGILSIHQVPLTNDGHRTQILKLLRGARKKWLNNKALIYGFAQLSQSVGICRAFTNSSHLLVDFVVVDRFYAPITVMLYLASVVFGSFILLIRKIIKRLNEN